MLSNIYGNTVLHFMLVQFISSRVHQGGVQIEVAPLTESAGNVSYFTRGDHFFSVHIFFYSLYHTLCIFFYVKECTFKQSFFF